MSLIKRASSIIALTFLLAFNTACSKNDSGEVTKNEASQNVNSTTSTEFEKAFSAANKLRLEAAALEYEWRDTKMYLDQAKEEFTAGNTEAAMQLVDKAHKQSELAIAQAKTEATAWKNSVPK
jgi:hypothetical protein